MNNRTEDNFLRSRDLLENVLRPHTELATDLLSLVQKLSSGDPTHRFQIAGLIIFLSGVDKALSLALQLLYLAGRVEWNWLIGRRHPPVGQIECNPGMTAKLRKLEDLGLDLSEFQWLVDLRNWYVHDCSMYAGYKVGVENGEDLRPILRAHGPEVSYSTPPVTAIGGDSIAAYAEGLTAHLGDFLDRIGWQGAWTSIQQQLQRLPVNPEPEYSQIVRENDPTQIHHLITCLNERYVGDGLSRLLVFREDRESQGLES